MDEHTFPQALTLVREILPAEISKGAVDGMGDRCGPARALLLAGIAPPDVMTGMTLHLLASQPRRPRPDGAKPKGAIEGSVWVREQVTYHAPMQIGESIAIEGSSLGRFSRRGRRYGVNHSTTRGADGRLLASNHTTGLVSYRKDPELPDAYEGEEAAPPGPDFSRAGHNPCLGALRQVREGDVVGADPVRVTLELMRIRDAHRDDNPIHTDPEVAKREGLAAPIAGGSHVVAFLQAALMEAWGPEALLHGAHFDLQWKGQTYAGATIRPTARVVRATRDQLELSLEIEGENRVAVVGRAVIPLSARS